MLRLFALSLLICVAAPRSARAEPVHALPYKLSLDLSLTLAALGIWAGTEIAKPYLAPDACHWCRSNGFDASVRDSWRLDDAKAARRASNWITLGVLPLSLAAVLSVAAVRDHAAAGLPEDLLLIAEAVAFSGLANQAVKYLAGRERPFVHELAGSDKAHTAHPADNNLSFYSSHTSMAFSTAVAAGTVASMRGYRAAPYVWAVGVPLAALSAYLRIAADRHYLSDVLVGAALGSAFGALTPWLMHRVRALSPSSRASRRSAR